MENSCQISLTLLSEEVWDWGDTASLVQCWSSLLNEPGGINWCEELFGRVGKGTETDEVPQEGSARGRLAFLVFLSNFRGKK